MGEVVIMPRDEKDPEDIARGERMRQAWERSGMSRQDFADAVGIHYNHVPRLWAGIKLSPTRLSRVAEVLGVTERHLIRGNVYTQEFNDWLKLHAPSNLLDVERELLAGINFPLGHHPGVRWYSTALESWRMGTQDSLLGATHVRRKRAS